MAVGVKDKLVTVEGLGVVIGKDVSGNDVEATYLKKDFSGLSIAPTPYNGNEIIPLRYNGSNYETTVNELLAAAGGGGGTSQTALVHYVKNCGTISTLNWTNSTVDNNITENMVVLKAELSNPAAQTSDWTCRTSNGYVTISGTISGSTNVLLYFGVSLSTAPSIIVNLASNNSDNVLKTNPTPGVMGVLGLSNGGTGVNATDMAELRWKIGAVANTGGTITGNLYVGTATSNAERSVRAVSNAGTIYLFAEGNSSGNRGIYTTNASNEGKYVMVIGQDNEAILTGSATGNVAKTGDTMTGNLTVQKTGSGEVAVKVESVQSDGGTRAKIWLDSAYNGKHGLWSDGYYKDSKFETDGEWLIYRETDGSVIVADHYNKSEVEARGVLFEDVSVGKVDIGSGGYCDIRNKKPSGKTIINAAIQNFGTTGGALSVTADGAYIMGAPNTTTTNVTVRYYYRG